MPIAKEAAAYGMPSSRPSAVLAVKLCRIFGEVGKIQRYFGRFKSVLWPGCLFVTSKMSANISSFVNIGRLYLPDAKGDRLSWNVVNE